MPEAPIPDLLCEATDNQRFNLWETHSPESLWIINLDKTTDFYESRKDLTVHEWKQGVGYSFQCGYIGKKRKNRAVVIQINFDTIVFGSNRHRKIIGFWHVRGQYTSYPMIRGWFDAFYEGVGVSHLAVDQFDPYLQQVMERDGN